MAVLASPLARKFGRLLKKRFPPPAKVRVIEHNGVAAVVTSDEFRDVEVYDRQLLVEQLLASELTREEAREVQIVVCVTPDEGTGYLAGTN